MLYIYTENFFFWSRLKNFIKRILGRGVRGPKAVLQSLLRGLRKFGIDLKFNVPLSPHAEMACALSGPKVLKYLINQKQAGKLKYLVAGPNLVQTPNDFGGLIARPEVDLCLVPSEQVKIAYERYNPALRGRIAVWYTGVDEDFWKPQAEKESRKKVLIYQKNAPLELVLKTENVIKELGFECVRIVYGQYFQKAYKKALNESLFTVFFSQSESQGIALAEAWAMDVPTLVWNPKKPHPHFPDMTDNPAPFLSEKTGKFWGDINELAQQIKNIRQLSESYSPREWVLNNMTDIKSAELFLGILNKLERI